MQALSQLSYTPLSCIQLLLYASVGVEARIV